MSLIRINRNPPRRQLAVFAGAWLVFLGAAGATGWSRGRHGTAEALWAAAVALPLLGAAFPRVLRYAYLGLSYATYPVGFVVSHIALAVIYYLVLTPLGLTLRLFGHDPLARKFEPGAKTYWTPREKPKAAESYLNQN